MQLKRLPHLFALASALFITPVNAQASAVPLTAASRKIQAMKSALLTVCAVVILSSGTGIAGAATASGTYLDAMTTHALGSDTSLSDPDWSRGIITDGTRPFEDITTRSVAPMGTAAYVLYSGSDALQAQWSPSADS
jgi:hypothetical protein